LGYWESGDRDRWDVGKTGVDKGGDEGVGGCQKWVRVIAGFKLQTYVHCKKG